MGFNKGAPQAPNASDTAAAQQSANLINQYSPYGSSTYTQTGTGPTGVPTYRQDTTLSPQAQQALDATLGTQTNVANAAKGLSANIGSELGQPLDWSSQQNYLNGITNGALDKSWDRQGQQFETDLINRGIRPGSTQYSSAQGDFRTDRSNAYNQANVANYNTALQSQLGLRNQKINELTGLLSAGQVQTPQFGATPQTDVAGIAQQGYQNQMAQYNQNQSQLGGLFSAGASLIPLFSDARLKTDIEPLGKMPSGLQVYSYRYLWDAEGTTRTGVMAHEAAEMFPEAVSVHDSGFMMVDYGSIH